MFRVNYPEDFTSEGLRGKAIDFTATVVNVQQKQIPELNDEFARLVSEHQTLDELTATVRKNFAEMNEHQAEQKMREDLVETILEDYDFLVPPTLVEKQTTDRLRQFANMLMQRGIPREYLNEIDWKERSAEARVMSVRDIRAALVIGRIGAAENIQVTPDEINEEIAIMAEENGISVNEMRATLTKNEGISSIESRLSYNKALDLVVANAQITVEEVTAEQLAQEAAQAGNGQAAASETDAPTTQE
jgi:trigger factor